MFTCMVFLKIFCIFPFDIFPLFITVNKVSSKHSHTLKKGINFQGITLIFREFQVSSKGKSNSITFHGVQGLARILNNGNGFHKIFRGKLVGEGV